MHSRPYQACEKFELYPKDDGEPLKSFWEVRGKKNVKYKSIKTYGPAHLLPLWPFVEDCWLERHEVFSQASLGSRSWNGSYVA